MREVTWPEFLAYFDPEVHDQIKRVSRGAGVDAVVMFENVQLDSSALGRRTALVVGPGRTAKSVEACAGKWLNDLPSQRQYPQCFVRAPHQETP